MNDRATAHAAQALQRILDPTHPHPYGEAKRQLKRLTAQERAEVHEALVALNLMLVGIGNEPATEIDRDIDHKAIFLNVPWDHYRDEKRTPQIPVRFSQR
jgi:hypothetical protein